MPSISPGKPLVWVADMLFLRFAGAQILCAAVGVSGGLQVDFLGLLQLATSPQG